MVTDQRVIFETDALDLETGLISITYKKIKKVKDVNTLMVIPNGIELELKSRDKFRFAVWKRKELLELINKKIFGKKGRDWFFDRKNLIIFSEVARTSLMALL